MPIPFAIMGALALSLLSDAGVAERDLPPFSRRLLWLFRDRRADVAFLTAELVCSLVLPGYGDRASPYLDPCGLQRVVSDLEQIEGWRGPEALSRFCVGHIARGTWWAQRPGSQEPCTLPARTRYDALVPWLSNVVRRAVDDPAPIKVNQRWVGRRGLPKVEVTDDLIREHGSWVGAHRDYALDCFPTAREYATAKHLADLYGALPVIADWVGAGQAGDVMRLSPALAIHRSRRWHAQLARGAAAAETETRSAIPAASRLLATLSDGWTLQELAPGDLRAEGDAMGHCVGRVDAYASEISRGVGRVLSVRDPAGAPVFTLELRRTSAESGEPWRLSQLRGPGNRRPGLSMPRERQLDRRVRRGGTPAEELRRMVELEPEAVVIDEQDAGRAAEALWWLVTNEQVEASPGHPDLLALEVAGLLPGDLRR